MFWLDTLADIVDIVAGILEILATIAAVVNKPHNNSGSN